MPQTVLCGILFPFFLFVAESLNPIPLRRNDEKGHKKRHPKILNLGVPWHFTMNLESDFNYLGVYDGLPLSHVKNMER